MGGEKPGTRFVNKRVSLTEEALFAAPVLAAADLPVMEVASREKSEVRGEDQKFGTDHFLN